jgi:hypothetical protein
MPTPKWKLVVDVGVPPPPANGSVLDITDVSGQAENRADELLLLIRTYFPADKNSPLAQFLPGFTSLRLLLEMPEKTPREEELAQTLTESFASYCRSGRAPSDVAWMVARDYMVLSQQHNQTQPTRRRLSQQYASAAPNTLGHHSVQAVPQGFANVPPTQQNVFLQQAQAFDIHRQMPGQPSA